MFFNHDDTIEIYLATGFARVVVSKVLVDAGQIETMEKGLPFFDEVEVEDD